MAKHRLVTDSVSDVPIWGYDIAAVAMLAGVLFTSHTVLFFHGVFFVVTVAALTMTREQFAPRAIVYSILNSVLVVESVIVGDTPSEELIEIPLLVSIFTVVFIMAQRWHESQKHLHQLNLELKEAMLSKDEFLGVVGHELGTPLTSIRGFAELIDVRFGTLSQDDHKRYNRLIISQSRRLQALVEDLMTMARLRVGAAAVNAESIDLRHVVAAAVDIFPELEVQIVVEGDAHVFADPGHVEQMLLNYLTNARKYGRPPVVIDVRDHGGRVALRVTDQGEGVPYIKQGELFTPFERLGASRDIPGWGLGLAIVKDLAELQGGEAFYETSDSGACFAITLPRDEASAAAALSAAAEDSTD